jgi:hypothetical protein
MVFIPHISNRFGVSGLNTPVSKQVPVKNSHPASRFCNQSTPPFDQDHAKKSENVIDLDFPCRDGVFALFSSSAAAAFIFFPLDTCIGIS